MWFECNITHSRLFFFCTLTETELNIHDFFFPLSMQMHHFRVIFFLRFRMSTVHVHGFSLISNFGTLKDFFSLDFSRSKWDDTRCTMLSLWICSFYWRWKPPQNELTRESLVRRHTHTHRRVRRTIVCETTFADLFFFVFANWIELTQNEWSVVCVFLMCISVCLCLCVRESFVSHTLHVHVCVAERKRIV